MQNYGTWKKYYNFPDTSTCHNGYVESMYHHQLSHCCEDGSKWFNNDDFLDILAPG
jgi:hypothetical protein